MEGLVKNDTLMLYFKVSRGIYDDIMIVYSGYKLGCCQLATGAVLIRPQNSQNYAPHLVHGVPGSMCASVSCVR